MKRGQRCLVIDKRHHIGGNIYCENIEGINVHKYGAHIFHTSNKSIWDYVNAIVPFNRYTNSPVALASDGRMYNLPFNMNTFYQMWGVKTPAEVQTKLDEQRRAEFEGLRGREPENLEEQALILVGRDIYELLIKEYTEKQWGRKCSDLPAFIIRRLPVRMTFDNNYFNDLYQGIPIGGYNRLIEGLLKGVDIKLDTDFFKQREELSALAGKIVYTGPIDQFYAYRLVSYNIARCILIQKYLMSLIIKEMLWLIMSQKSIRLLGLLNINILRYLVMLFITIHVL